MTTGIFTLGTNIPYWALALMIVGALVVGGFLYYLCAKLYNRNQGVIDSKVFSEVE
jgi:hypothetical protein